MSCECNKTPCCCRVVISKLGEKSKVPGPQGPPMQAYGEAGAFTLTLAENVLGLVATGGTLSGTAANPILTISTTKKAKLVHFNCRHTDAVNVGSYGKDNVVGNDCMYYNDAPVVASDDSNSIILINVANNGFTGKITAITINTIVVTFTKLNSGANVTGNWHAITS